MHFPPQYLQLDPPYTPDNYRTAIEAAAKLKPKVILIDSASHENDAVNEHHDRELTRRPARILRSVTRRSSRPGSSRKSCTACC
jgi:chemotaxis response regulator CheB